jgi:hypothetical protein
MKQLFHPSILPSFHPVFKEDLDEATVYHNDQCEGLGDQFSFCPSPRSDVHLQGGFL